MCLSPISLGKLSVELNNADNQFTMPGCEESEEDSSQEETPVTPWDELSIVERVGLNSIEMSEDEVAAAFTQIALAFRCDQYTLKQRLQVEEHARNLAEENIQVELTQGRETLETLKVLCLDSKRSRILQRLELSLDIMGGTVERIANTAEVLGAVHQEARVSRAVDLMVAHVENLKRRHDRDVVELEETRKLIQRNLRRSLTEPKLMPDMHENEGKKKDKKSSEHQNSRRRVSISVITKHTQEKGKQDLSKLVISSEWSSKTAVPSPALNSEPSCSVMTRDDVCSLDDRSVMDPDDTVSQASAIQVPLDSPPVPNPECPPSPPKETAAKKKQSKNSSWETLRQRHKSKALLKKKAEKDKRSSMTPHHQFFIGLDSKSRQRPQAHCCRWALFCSCLLLLVFMLTLTFLFWKFQSRMLH